MFTKDKPQGKIKVMCGFAGILGLKVDQMKGIAILEDMGEAIRHRGPDGHGEWFDTTAEVGFTHQRLAIVDLSRGGHQPMASFSGRYMIAFNGEIYNYIDLRIELEKTNRSFLSRSDTEVLLTAIEIWGLETTLQRLHGMFAFSLFDLHERKLFLVRDRFGEKPLYWGHIQNQFVFTSELSALKKVPGFKSELNSAALSAYSQLGHVPDDLSIFKNIHKLLPGSMLSVSKSRIFDPTVENYFSLADRISKRSIFSGDIVQAREEFETKLTKVITRQLIADVPLGCFLSSGIDSSLISTLAQKSSLKKIQTFSAGFNDEEFDESRAAQKIAEKIGTEHHELRISEIEALKIIPQLGRLYDEPFADSSQIPTLLLSKMIRRHVTVALSGDGGDEVMAGYNRHRYFAQYWPPSLATKTISKIASTQPIQALLKLWVPSRRLEQIQKFSSTNLSLSLADAYHHLTGFQVIPSVIPPLKTRPEQLTNTENIIFWDQMHYLPNDILVKVDRAAMAYGLETRIPFLDHALVEWCWNLPLQFKIDQHRTKILSREVLKKYIPEASLSQPKKGFAVPLHRWMRGPLKELFESRLRHSSGALLDPQDIVKLWTAYRNGNDRLRDFLWAVFIFELWYAEV